MIAVLLTLVAIRSGVARILAACVANVGKVASYGHEARAFVLTPLDKDGAPSWRNADDIGSPTRDAVVRVFASAETEDSFSVMLGVKCHGGNADRKAARVTGLSREQADTLLTATVLDLANGRFAGPLSQHIPNVRTMRVKYVERPDQQSTGRKSGTVVAVADDAMSAMLQAIKAAEAADKPADKPAK